MRTLLLITTAFIIGCGIPTIQDARLLTQPESPAEYLNERTEYWKSQIETNGWSDALVHEIVHNVQKLSVYSTNSLGKWETPETFEKNNFSGDCTEIAGYMVHVFHTILGYKDCMVRVYGTFGGKHAKFRIRMPSGEYRDFETAPLRLIDNIALEPIADVFPDPPPGGSMRWLTTWRPEDWAERVDKYFRKDGERYIYNEPTTEK